MGTAVAGDEDEPWFAFWEWNRDRYLPGHATPVAAEVAPGATSPLDALRARATAALFAGLAAPEPEVRAGAALALGRAQARDAVAALTTLAHDADPAMAASGILALGAHGGPAATLALLHRGGGDIDAADRSARAWCILALADVQAHRAMPGVDAVVERWTRAGLGDAELTTAAAVHALACRSLAVAEACRPLATDAGAPPGLRAAAILTLPLVPDEGGTVLGLAHDRRPAIRASAAAVVPLLADGWGPDTARVLLADADRATVAACAGSLTLVRADRIGDALVRLAASESRPSARLGALCAAAATPELAVELLPRIRDHARTASDPSRGGAWLLAAGLLHDAEGRAPVLAALDARSGASARSRASAIDALGLLAAPADHVVLRRTLADHADPAVRGHAADVLARALGAGAVADLAAALRRDPEPLARAAIAEALGRTGAPVALLALLPAAEQTADVDLRAAALRSVGRCLGRATSPLGTVAEGGRHRALPPWLLAGLRYLR